MDTTKNSTTLVYHDGRLYRGPARARMADGSVAWAGLPVEASPEEIAAAYAVQSARVAELEDALRDTMRAWLGEYGGCDLGQGRPIAERARSLLSGGA